MTLPLVLLALLLPACSSFKEANAERYLEEGKRRLAAKDYDNAAIAFRKAIQKNSKMGEAYYQLALTDLERGGDISRALTALQEAMTLMPANEDVKKRLAEIYLFAYIYQGAVEQYPLQQARGIAQSLLQQNPKSFPGLMLRGQAALLENKPQEAAGYFELAQQLQPDSAEALAGLGMVHLRANELARGEELLLKALTANPQMIPIYDALYSVYARTNRFEKAEAILRDRLERMPAEPAARTSLAYHFFRFRKLKEMEETLAPFSAAGSPYKAGPLAAGDFYRSIGRIAEARGHYDSGLLAAGGDVPLATEYRKRLANLLLMEGKREEAEAAYAGILAGAPDDPESRSRHALLNLEKDAANSVKEFEALVKESPSNPLLRYNLGLAHVANRQTEEARTAFIEASRMQRNFLEPRLALAQILLDADRFREVQQYAAEVLTVNPLHPQGRYFRAAAYTGLGNYPEARKTLEELLKDFPQFREAHLQMAFLDLAERNYGAAQARLRTIYEGSNDVRALTGMAEVHLAQQQNDQALKLAQDELARRPDEPRIRLLVARTALRVQDYELAIKEFIRLAERDQNWDYLYLQLGAAHQLSGDLPRAILAFRRASQISPKSLEAMLRLAYAYEVSGQPKEAIAAYRQALALNPNTPVAMNNLAYLLAEHGGDLDEALKLAQTALQQAPQQRYIADTVGWVFLKKKDAASAVQIFSGLVRKYPEEAVFRFHLGAGLVEQGDRTKAKAELEAALERQPAADIEKRIRALLAQLS